MPKVFRLIAISQRTDNRSNIVRPFCPILLISGCCTGNACCCRSCQTGTCIPASKGITCPGRCRQRQTCSIGITCIFAFVRYRSTVFIVSYGVGVCRPLRIIGLIPGCCTGNACCCRSCQTGTCIPASKGITCPGRCRQCQTCSIGITCILAFVRYRSTVFIVSYGVGICRPVSMQRMRCRLRHGCRCRHLTTAGGCRIPASKGITCPGRCRELSINTTA